MIMRVQMAQQSGGNSQFTDETEDPMHMPLVGLTLRYYRYFLSDTFWKTFFDFLLLPPQDRSDAPPTVDPTVTPAYVWDAIGRSIFLHHLLQSHEAQEVHRATVATADAATAEASSAVAKSTQTFERATDEAVAKGADDLGIKHAIDEAAKVQAKLAESDVDPFLLQRHVMLVAARIKDLLQFVAKCEEEKKPLAGQRGGPSVGPNAGGSQLRK